MKLIVTEKGSKLQTNTWKEGQEIKCSDSLAELFIKNGYVVDADAEEVKPVVEDEKAEEVKPTKKAKK